MKEQPIKEEITDAIYKAYGTDSGILFGIKEREIVLAIIEFTLNRVQTQKIQLMEQGQIAELLRNRVKCIGNGEYHYPESVCKVGDILYEAVQESNKGYYYSKDGYVSVIFEPENYPHLFKPLAWYEERKPEEMPEYVKRVDGSEVFERVFRYDGGGSIMVKFPKGIYGKGTAGPIGLLNVIPATSAEYNQYINSNP